MDKREFLSALEKSLSVLQEDELRDIVSEYEQHIDIKVAKGLTEEEAIADFGSFSELTAELLEAYHVRADYAAGGGEKRKAAPDREKRAGEERKAAVRAAIKGAGARLRESGRWTARQITRPFSWLSGKRGAYSAKAAGLTGSRFTRGFRLGGERKQEKIQRRRKKKDDMIIHGMGAGVAGIFRWLAGAGAFVLRMIWNGCWLLFSAIMAGFGMFCLYGLGVLAVLLAQGYPLAGITLGCLGLVMCTFSASVIGFTYLKRQRKGLSGDRRFKASGKSRDGESGDKDAEDRENMEEVQDGDCVKTEESEAVPMDAYSRRGGETAWVNCGV